MPLEDMIALAIGFGIAIVVALLATGVRDSSDTSMRWEGGVAAGFTAIIFLGPFWIAQAVLTVLATCDGTGMAVGMAVPCSRRRSLVAGFEGSSAVQEETCPRLVTAQRPDYCMTWHGR